MAKKFLVPIDMTKLEIRNLLLELIAGNASSPVEGQVWYDTTGKRIKFRTNAANLAVVTDGGDLTAGSVLNTALATNPLARANHTGTQLAATISDFDTQVRVSRLDQMAAPTASVSLNSQKITNLATPTAGTDAATKQYVDDSVAGLSWKNEVRVATTAAGTFATSFANGQSIDGQTLATGDRILIKDQATQTENGIYTVNASGAPTRATDADSANEINGAAVFVMSGTTNGGTRWVCNVTGAITLGSTNITFVQFGGGTTYSAGNGLTLASTTFSVVADTGISVSGTGVAINTSVVARFSTGTIGNGSLTTITYTHGIGHTAVMVQVYDTSTGANVEPDIQNRTSTTVDLVFAVAPTTNQYTVVVVG